MPNPGLVKGETRMICKHDNAVCICGKGENDYCPIKPMTNEESLEQASTEEKALFLARLYVHSRKINLPELLLRNAGTGEVTDVAEYIGKWLKEKHNE